MRTWFKAKADDEEGEIHIYDEIGAWGITAADFIREMRAMKSVKTIYLRINSPGGSVFDGLAIHNSLQRSKARVVVTVDGIAASIASIIAMAGDEVIMPENAMMMIHDPSGVVVGNSRDMRELAETLDKIRDSLVSVYAGKTGLEREEITQMMEEETWLTASEALDMGFADRVDEPVKIAASFDLTKFRNAPASAVPVRGNPAALHPASKQEPSMSDANDTADMPEVAAGEDITAANVEATEAAADNAVADAVAQAKSIDAVAQATADANARAAEIIAMCVNAGVPAKASEFVASGKSVGEIAIDILKTRDPVSETEISARHAPAMRATANWSKAVDRVNGQHKG